MTFIRDVQNIYNWRQPTTFVDVLAMIPIDCKTAVFVLIFLACNLPIIRTWISNSHNFEQEGCAIKNFISLKMSYCIAGYFRNRNFCTSSKIWIFENLNFKKFIFWSSRGFQIIEKSLSQITCLCLLRTYLLIRMAHEGLLTTVEWQPLISGNLDKKSGTMMDQTELAMQLL